MNSWGIFQYKYSPSSSSLWPYHAMWHWWSLSTLVQAMAWCLTAPSHYMNQCWLFINMANSRVMLTWIDTQNINPQVAYEIYTFEITTPSPGQQWPSVSALMLLMLWFKSTRFSASAIKTQCLLHKTYKNIQIYDYFGFEGVMPVSI